MLVIRGMGLYLDGNVVESSGGLALGEEIMPSNAEGLRVRISDLYRRASEHPSEFVWIGLFEPSKAELALVQDIFTRQAQAQQEPPPRQRVTWPWLVLGAAVALAVGAALGRLI